MVNGADESVGRGGKCGEKRLERKERERDGERKRERCEVQGRSRRLFVPPPSQPPDKNRLRVPRFVCATTCDAENLPSFSSRSSRARTPTGVFRPRPSSSFFLLLFLSASLTLSRSLARFSPRSRILRSSPSLMSREERPKPKARAREIVRVRVAGDEADRARLDDPYLP